MPSVTLTYETPQFLHSVIGNDIASLRKIADAFDIQVTSRDGWIKLDGPEDRITAAQAVLAELEKARRGGAEVSPSML